MTISIDQLILFFLSLVALFSPLAGVASHATITGRYSSTIQRKIALWIVIYITILLVIITWVGQALLELLGVTVPALNATAGLALLLSAVPMMTGNQNARPVKNTFEEIETETWQKETIMPLIFPLSVGASHAALVIATSSQYDTIPDLIAISFVCFLFAIVVGVTNFFSGPISQRLKPLGQDILTRLAGIVLTAIGFSLLVRGITELVLNVV